MNWIIQLLSGGILSSIGEELRKAYELRLKADNDSDKLAAEESINILEARKAILLEEQKNARTSWIRPMLALPVIIYVWKLIVWDTVLKMGVTPYPGDFINWVVITIIGAYFLTRPFERR